MTSLNAFKPYPCKCGREFKDVVDFSDHFTRDEHGNITGCKKKG